MRQLSKEFAFQKCLYASLSSSRDSSETLNSERCYAAVVTASDLHKPGGYVPTTSTLQKVERLKACHSRYDTVIWASASTKLSPSHSLDLRNTNTFFRWLLWRHPREEQGNRRILRDLYQGSSTVEYNKREEQWRGRRRRSLMLLFWRLTS